LGAAELIAERVGRDSNDRQVRALAGATIGVMISLMPKWADDPDSDLLASIDDALAFLETGLPLAKFNHAAASSPPRTP